MEARLILLRDYKVLVIEGDQLRFPSGESMGEIREMCASLGITVNGTSGQLYTGTDMYISVSTNFTTDPTYQLAEGLSYRWIPIDFMEKYTRRFDTVDLFNETLLAVQVFKTSYYTRMFSKSRDLNIIFSRHPSWYGPVQALKQTGGFRVGDTVEDDVLATIAIPDGEVDMGALLVGLVGYNRESPDWTAPLVIEFDGYGMQMDSIPGPLAEECTRLTDIYGILPMDKQASKWHDPAASGEVRLDMESYSRCSIELAHLLNRASNNPL